VTEVGLVEPPVSPAGGTAPELVLELRELAVGYGSISVAKKINLQARAGSIVAVLGRNGAGKTTTLHTIAGVLAPLAGEVVINGRRARGALHQRVREHGLGLVTEDRAVIRRLSVIDNLRLGSGHPDVAFDLFPELKPLRRRKAGLLSGGEQQMVVLGRCLAAQPRLLLVDELSFGLAPLVVRRLLDELAAIARQRNVAVVLVEQHPALALSVADYGYVLSRGEIRMSGTADELSTRLSEIESSYLSDASAPGDGRVMPARPADS